MNPIQLYSLNTPNGQKIGIAIEEMQLPYTPYVVNIMEGDQFQESFLRINPNAKIPAIVDPDGPGGSHTVFESGAILIYLAEKSGKFLSHDPKLRSETLQWLFFQVGGVGPMFGQFGHFFKYAKEKCNHPYPLERYATEAKRLLTVLNKRLMDRKFLVGEEYSIADMAVFPWVIALDTHYQASDFLELAQFSNLNRWKTTILAREKTRPGMEVCALP